MRVHGDSCLPPCQKGEFYMYLVICATTALLALVGGIFLLRRGLAALLSDTCKTRLCRMRLTPWRSLTVGALAAALMQSSTAVSLLAVSLVSARTMTFKQSLGIILGANIGTCSTVQFFAFQPPGEWLYFGTALLLAAFARPRLRRFAQPLAGLLFIFAALDALATVSRDAFGPEEFYALLAAFDAPVFAPLCLGILATALLQSSSAATLLLMAVAARGDLSLETACYIVYGNNIGSCLSSLVVACGAPCPAKRTALSHLLLNLLGALAFLPLTGIFAAMLTAATSDFSGQVALAHTAFNLLSSLAVMPWINAYAHLIAALVPEKRNAPFICRIRMTSERRARH